MPHQNYFKNIGPLRYFFQILKQKKKRKKSGSWSDDLDNFIGSLFIYSENDRFTTDRVLQKTALLF